MKNAFLQENKSYSFNQLSRQLEFNQTQTQEFIEAYKDLRFFRFDSKGQVSLNYVGFLVFEERMIFVVPKYFRSELDSMSKITQVLQVIRLYGKNFELQINSDSGENQTTSILEIMLQLVDDFFQFGIIISDENKLEINGTGTVDWTKTVDNGLMFMKNSAPVYTELVTRKTIRDANQFISYLHEAILAEIFENLNSTGILEVFGITNEVFEARKIDDFGELDYLIDRLTTMLNSEYNSRKIHVIQLLLKYLSNKEIQGENGQTPLMFGVEFFEHVWEAVGEIVFNNDRDVPLRIFSDAISTGYSHKTFKSAIDQPLWHVIAGEYENSFTKPTIIPDMIKLQRISGGFFLSIFDFKYYDVRIQENNLSGQPGVESIVKQYMYELAYRKIFTELSILETSNAFLFPVEGEEFIKMGSVNLGMLKKLGLKDISLVGVPATKLFEAYLNGETLKIGAISAVL